MHTVDAFHAVLFGAVLVLLGLAIALAWAGVPMGTCLVVVTLVPIAVVVGNETVGYRHAGAALSRNLSE